MEEDIGHWLAHRHITDRQQVTMFHVARSSLTIYNYDAYYVPCFECLCLVVLRLELHLKSITIIIGTNNKTISMLEPSELFQLTGMINDYVPQQLTSTHYIYPTICSC